MASPALPMFNSGTQPKNGSQLFNQPGMPGSNQYVGQNPGVAVVPGQVPAGAIPQQSSPVPTVAGGASSQWGTPGIVPGGGGGTQKAGSQPLPVGAEQVLGGGFTSVPTLDPGLTSQLFAFLQQQIGQGVTPFNLSTPLPSGGSTQAGQLTAPLNPIEQSLQQFYSTGGASGGTPGMQTLQQESQGISALPQWQAMIAAMNGPQGATAQQMAQIQQMFGAEGGIGGSPYAQAMTQAGEQNALNQNALLASLTQSNIGLQQTAANELMQGGTQFGSDLQTMDQTAIQNMLNQFMIDSPQNSPYLQYLFSGATASPGAISGKSSVSGTEAALSGAGSALTGIADLYGAIKGS